ncbi:unnamed protein product [marine sediment metagenome]|uniref:Uncharacterized protein n=1 Tax=marine sediment metagenome TaxID=412755 RepID=X1VG50_9ZZZZ
MTIRGKGVKVNIKLEIFIYSIMISHAISSSKNNVICFNSFLFTTINANIPKINEVPPKTPE